MMFGVTDLYNSVISSSDQVHAIWGDIHTVNAASFWAIQFPDLATIMCLPIPNLKQTGC